jgi:hypothetical protein
MATWSEFQSAEPELAETARALLYRDGSGKAMLATVRGDAPPHINPISVGIVGDELCAFIFPSGKLTDLTSDGRYALHAHLDPQAPNELLLRGRARELTDPDVRAAAIAAWPFEPDDEYRLFAFDIETVTVGRRDSPNEWPPRYSRWRS